MKAVCNEGQLPGAIGVCVVVNDDGAGCDDGLFCTTADTCAGGRCVGGPQNDCGLEPEQCNRIVCDEGTRRCSAAPLDDGAPCSTDQLCQVNARCTRGVCSGSPRDCFFSPFAECNVVTCNPATGACEPTPDTTKNGQGCSLTGERCSVNKTCDNGQCLGGSPRDCSALSVGCNNGVCDPATGNCAQEAVPVGGVCLSGVPACNVGHCDAANNCVPTPVPDGTACNDFNSCTSGDACAAGACAGAAVTDCRVYFETGFEDGCPPSGWTLGGDWECGVPTGPGPGAANTGTTCIATQIDGPYSDGQSFGTANAQTPQISLASATHPLLRFAAWIETESCCDGMNVKVSTDGGATFAVLQGFSPPYNGVLSEPVWGGSTFATGWRTFSADLTAYVGQNIVLRFSFQSDGSITAAGPYVDDVFIGELEAVPLAIVTRSPLPNATVGAAYTTTVLRSGGSSGAVWSIVSGTNNGWITIDPATGILSGTPAAANAGPFGVTVRVEEPSFPSNAAEQLLEGTVL